MADGKKDLTDDSSDAVSGRTSVSKGLGSQSNTMACQGRTDDDLRLNSIALSSDNYNDQTSENWQAMSEEIQEAANTLTSKLGKFVQITDQRMDELKDDVRQNKIKKEGELQMEKKLKDIQEQHKDTIYKMHLKLIKGEQENEQLQEINHKMKQEVEKLTKENTELQQTRERLEEELESKCEMINRFEVLVNEDAIEKQLLHEEIARLRQDLYHKSEENNKSRNKITGLENICYDLDNKSKGWKMTFQQVNREHEQEFRKLQQEIESLTKSRDDLRDRFSKVAKLNENNPDIDDLSDHDRAMKLAERYSAIYDDEWTDAFQEQQEKLNRKTEDIVRYLLDVLKASYQFCEKTAAIQMEALRNVFLHPYQDASLERNAMGAQGGLFDIPRIKSAEDKTLKDLRRKISSNMVSELKEQFLVQFKKETADKKAMDLSLPYIGKCVEICWLMVLHDPQLHMGVDIKPDTRMDTNVYASYQNSGSVIEYLVWPPLFNGKSGGLLARGTAQPRKKQGKGKGK